VPSVLVREAKRTRTVRGGRQKAIDVARLASTEYCQSQPLRRGVPFRSSSTNPDKRTE